MQLKLNHLILDIFEIILTLLSEHIRIFLKKWSLIPIKRFRIKMG